MMIYVHFFYTEVTELKNFKDFKGPTPLHSSHQKQQKYVYVWNLLQRKEMWAFSSYTTNEIGLQLVLGACVYMSRLFNIYIWVLWINDTMTSKMDFQLNFILGVKTINFSSLSVSL